MVNQNPELFDKFREIHDKYREDPNIYQDEFNRIGEEVQDVIRRFENMLCSHSQNSGFGKYSTNLSDKFQAQVKLVFPKINSIGLKRS